jgi:hypothetical protein
VTPDLAIQLALSGLSVLAALAALGVRRMAALQIAKRPAQ